MAKATQVDGTILLPDGRSIPVVVSLDLAEIDRPKVPDVDSLLLRAIEVFGKTDKALSWLNTRNPSLEGRAPREVAVNIDGRERVNGILFDLEHGFPA